MSSAKDSTETMPNIGGADQRVSPRSAQFEEIDVARDEALRKIGRNIVNFQKMEAMLKALNAQLIDELRLTQASAAARLDVSQPKISAVKNYRLDGFSVERLMGFLTVLGQNIEIRISRRAVSRSPGKIVVYAV